MRARYGMISISITVSLSDVLEICVLHRPQLNLAPIASEENESFYHLRRESDTLKYEHIILQIAPFFDNCWNCLIRLESFYYASFLGNIFHFFDFIYVILLDKMVQMLPSN